MDLQNTQNTFNCEGPHPSTEMLWLTWKPHNDIYPVTFPNNDGAKLPLERPMVTLGVHQMLTVFL